jgi:hypothetical protein
LRLFSFLPRMSGGVIDGHDDLWNAPGLRGRRAGAQ